MKAITHTLVSLLALNWVPVSAAQESTPWVYRAGQLLDDCRNAERFVQEADAGRTTFSRELSDGFDRCNAYLEGYLDREFQVARSDTCIPDGVSVQQIRRLYVSFMERNPEREHLHRRLVLHQALSIAFVCAPGR